MNHIGNHLEVRSMPVADLRPAAYNPRREITPRSPTYRKLKRSLEEFGLVEPLVWNENTGHIVGGHLRLRILKDLNAVEVPVSVVRLTPEREKALNVILNNREAQGRFDPEKLRLILDELEPLGELESTGFTLSDLNALKLESIDTAPAEVIPDRVEVVLMMSKAVYDNASTKIDALIREYDLESHIRECEKRVEE